MPPIFVIGPDGEAQLVNSRIHQHILIVDVCSAQGGVAVGGLARQVVRIVRTDRRPAS